MARILLVDDEAGLLSVMARYVETLGHDVRTASSGREAMALLEEGGVDVVVTDINMPDVDGLEILNSVRRSVGSIPVLAISGGGLFGPEMLLDSADMLGAAATLEKPFELDELRRVLDDVLGEPDS